MEVCALVLEKRWTPVGFFDSNITQLALSKESSPRFQKTDL